MSQSTYQSLIHTLTIEVAMIQIIINSNFDLNLVLLTLDLIMTLILITAFIKTSKKKDTNPTVNTVNQVKVLESKIINDINMLRKTIERVKDNNFNILSAIEIKLKEMDRTALSINERLDKRFNEIESVLTNTMNVKVISRLEDIDCIFRSDGLIVYGNYDKKVHCLCNSGIKSTQKH